MNINDVIQITSANHLGTNEARNVYHYQCTAQAGSVGLGEILEGFALLVVTKVKDVLVGGTQIYALSARNITNGIDVLEASLTPPVDCTRAGDAASPFVALGIKLLRSNATTAQGQKRFSPLSETDLTVGVISAGLLTAAAALGVALVSDLEIDDTFGNTATLIPVIWGEALPERPKKGGGTLPARAAAANPIQGYQVAPNSTSQVSRKVGRGI